MIAQYTKLAAHDSAEAVATEARARANRRHGRLTAAQQGRPPLETLIVVEEMRKGDGYVVLVKNPEGAFESETLLLSWWLSQSWSHNKVANPFLWAAKRLEYGPHQRRMVDAVQHAIDDAGLGT